MLFDIKLLAIIIFAIYSFILFINLKSLVNIASNLVINHLILILFLSLTITNQNLFKETVLILILYLIANVFLLVNQGEIAKVRKKVKDKMPDLWVLALVFVSVVVVFFSTIFLAKTTINNLKIEQESQVLVEIQGDKNIETVAPENVKTPRQQRLEAKLQNNYLFKRSSEVIMLICFILPFLLIISSKKFLNKSLI